MPPHSHTATPAVPQPGPSMRTAWALSAGSAVAVGFARFDYALILPAMKADLGLTYAQAGWLNTANALGYLLGSLLAILGVGWLGNRRLFAGGIVLTTVALLATGSTHDFQWLAFHRFLAGLGGAGAFICGGVLSGVLGGRALMVFFSGAGLGTAAGGAVLPWLFQWMGTTAWPQAWLLVGAVSVPMTVAAWIAARGIAEPSARRLDLHGSWHGCVAIYVAYFVFGLGYIAYMTFMIEWVGRHATGAGQLSLVTSVMWVILGTATLVAPLLWRGLLARRPDGKPMAAAILVLAVGAALPLALSGVAGILASALLVGISVLVIPSAITSFVKTNLSQSAWGSAMAIATSLFAAGQTIGPVAAGWVSDRSGSLSTGLGASAAILLLGAMLAVIQQALPAGRAALSRT